MSFNKTQSSHDKVMLSSYGYGWPKSINLVFLGCYKGKNKLM